MRKQKNHVLRSPRLFFGLAVVQAVHSIEEYLTELYDWFPVITGKMRGITGFSPIVHMSGPVFIAVNSAIAVFMFIISYNVYKQKQWAWRIAGIVAIVELINGLVHISAFAYIGAYFPGVVSACGLLITALLFLRSSKVRVE